MASHNELRARRCLMAMVATATCNVSLPRLGRLQWRVGAVEEMLVELWA